MPQRKKYEIFCDNTPTKRLPNLRIMRGNMPGMEVNQNGQSQLIKGDADLGMLEQN